MIAKEMNDDARCKGTNRAGKRCGVARTKDSDYCRAHNPSLSGEDRFGSPEQSARAGAWERPTVPKVMELARLKAEEKADEIVNVYLDALEADAGVVVGNGPSAELELLPDHKTRLLAVRDWIDRVAGKPKQQQEVSGPGGGPIQTTGLDLRKLTDDELAALEEIMLRASQR